MVVMNVKILLRVMIVQNQIIYDFAQIVIIVKFYSIVLLVATVKFAIKRIVVKIVNNSIIVLECINVKHVSIVNFVLTVNIV